MEPCTNNMFNLLGSSITADKNTVTKAKTHTHSQQMTSTDYKSHKMKVTTNVNTAQHSYSNFTAIKMLQSSSLQVRPSTAFTCSIILYMTKIS